MSSINSYFTFKYSQPEEYLFSHDSVFLAREVFERLKTKSLSGRRVLDVGAGCGIVGLDFLFHCRQAGVALPMACDFLEVQDIYKPHFMANRNAFHDGGASPEKLQFLLRNFADLRQPEFADSYDLILSNPPYFRPEQGRHSPSLFKNRCRFFLDAGPTDLWLGIANSLKPGGEAYVLSRDLRDHGWEPLAEAQTATKGLLELEKIGDIRGTDLIRATKPPFKI